MFNGTNILFARKILMIQQQNLPDLQLNLNTGINFSSIHLFYINKKKKQKEIQRTMGVCEGHIDHKSQNIYGKQLNSVKVHRKILHKPLENENYSHVENQNHEKKVHKRRNSGIFKDHACPIDSQILQQVDKQLGEFEVPYTFRGEHCQKWKDANINKSDKWWYVGEWKQGLMYGKGVLYNRQEKKLVAGQFVGHKIIKDWCRIIFENGNYYIGEINDNYEPEGYGKMCYREGYEYTGEFISGIPKENLSVISEVSQSQNRFSKDSRIVSSKKEKSVAHIEFQNKLKNRIFNNDKLPNNKLVIERVQKQGLSQLSTIVSSEENKENRIY